MQNYLLKGTQLLAGLIENLSHEDTQCQNNERARDVGPEVDAVFKIPVKHFPKTRSDLLLEDGQLTSRDGLKSGRAGSRRLRR